MALAVADFVQANQPSNPGLNKTWLQTTTGIKWFTADGSTWIPLGNCYKPNMGLLSASGGIVEAPITGAHGHAPAENADIAGALTLEGVGVVTVPMLQAWRDRIVAELTVLQNLAAEAEGTDVTDTTVVGMLTKRSGSIAIKHGKTFNFADLSGPYGDLRPKFNGTPVDWSHCVVLAWPEALAEPDDGVDHSGKDVFIPNAYHATWNLGFPTGIWARWESTNPPILRVNAHGIDGQTYYLGVGFEILGWR